MTTLLTVISSLLWWVLYSSMAALVFALVGWSVLRWTERCAVVFNRIYFACLLWSMIGLLLIVGVAAYEGHLHPPYTALLNSGLLRIMLVLDMLVGVVLLWRLVPRIDARRIRPGSACMAIAMILAIGVGVATSLV
jgi:purine-cytosine permease-like protein